MDIKYRICACVLLALTAAFCASYTIADVKGREEVPTGPVGLSATAQPGSEGFLLCARDGYVAVVDPTVGETAVVTDIGLDTLREADRSLIESGLRVDSREELLSLLEDLGS